VKLDERHPKQKRGVPTTEKNSDRNEKKKEAQVRFYHSESGGLVARQRKLEKKVKKGGQPIWPTKQGWKTDF